MNSTAIPSYVRALGRHCLAGLAGLAGLASCQEQPIPHRTVEKAAQPVAAPKGIELDPAKLELFGALPEAAESKANPSTPDKIALGRMLYYDARLSKNEDLSCNSCHDLEKYGTDGKDFCTRSRPREAQAA